jgi:PPP family 3-phenylpropionic acid transporter
MNEKSENIKYRFLLGTHTMMFCVGFGYATSYLQNLQVPDGTIGFAISFFAVIGALFQLLLGRVADKSRRWNFKNLLILLAAVQLASSLAVPFTASFSMLSLVLFGFVLIITYSMLPLLSSVSFFYASQNLRVDFGIARGIGSTAYGAISIIMGKTVTAFGTGCIPLFAAGTSLALLIESMLLPSPAKYRTVHSEDALKAANVSDEGASNSFSGENAKSQNGRSGRETGISSPETRKIETSSPKTREKPLLLRYPAFTLMFLGLTVVMVFHNMNITYFVRIIEKTGGNSTSLGIALGIAAVMEIPTLFFYGKLSKKISSKTLLLISCLVFTMKALLFCIAGNVIAVYLIQGLSIGSFGLMAAAKVYYAHDTFEEKDVVTGQAFVSMTEALGMVMGSFFGGLIINASGINGVLWGGFAICAIGTALAAISLFCKQKKHSNANQ